MGCPICKRLERTFEGWNTECVRARSSLYSQFTSRFAAYDNVEMERARYELEEHQAVCVSTVRIPVLMPQREAPASLRILAA